MFDILKVGSLWLFSSTLSKYHILNNICHEFILSNILYYMNSYCISSAQEASKHGTFVFEILRAHCVDSVYALVTILCTLKCVMLSVF